MKLYTAEWRGDSKGWRLDSEESFRFLEKCAELGIENIHAHKGPTIRPLNRDAFDVGDVELDFSSDLAAVTVQDDALTVTVARDPLAEYLTKARETGLVTSESDRLFADREGEPLDSDPEQFESTVRDARLAATNIEGQGAICESLHESRNDVDFA